jgi:hypothetical protein
MGWAEHRIEEYQHGKPANWLERRMLEHANPVHYSMGLAAVAGFVVAVVLFVGLFNLIGLRFGKESGLSQLLFESRRSEALRLRDETMTHSIEVKRTIAADIVAGRLTMHKAAVRFQEANYLVENNDPDLLSDYQVPATEQGVYQQVLSWMQTEVSSLPAAQAKRILTPLEKEYESRFGPLESATDSPSANAKSRLKYRFPPVPVSSAALPKNPSTASSRSLRQAPSTPSAGGRL